MKANKNKRQTIVRKKKKKTKASKKCSNKNDGI